MSTTVLIIVISVVGILIGLVTIYLAVWSEYGIGKKIEKGFGDLRTSGATVAHDIDKRMGDLVEIIRMLVPIKGTETYKLTNIGNVHISVTEIGEGKTSYTIRTEKSIFTTKFLVETLNANNAFQEKERELFSDEQPKVHSPIATVLSVEIPSVDKEVCAKYMALFLNWLDTEYFEKKKEFSEAESAIGKYL